MHGERQHGETTPAGGMFPDAAGPSVKSEKDAMVRPSSTMSPVVTDSPSEEAPAARVTRTAGV
jgi:hypothetical protein